MHLASINVRVWENLHVNSGHVPKHSKGCVFKKKKKTTKQKPQSATTEVTTTGILRGGDNEREGRPLSPASEMQLN